MRWRTTRPVSVDEENPYWMSFSDIMSALLVIFILAAVILILQLMEKQKEIDERQVKFDHDVEQLKKAEQVRRTIIDEAVEELLRRNIQVQVSENHTILRIPNQLLGFDTGAYEIKSRYRETAQEIGEVLHQVISKEDRVRFLDTVFVEGHTDSQTYYGRYRTGNWELSAIRAISLWLFWQDKLGDADRLDLLANRDGDPLFSVSGYADTRPVNERQETDEDRGKNRRIDIRFTIRRPQLSEFEDVRKGLTGETVQ